jgi:hypothetical protein
LEELQKACKKTEKMFNVKISVDWRVKPETQNVSRETSEKKVEK